jgi:hypothetical protein
MNIKLIRKQLNKDETIGEMYVDGEFECYTLEDAVRESKVAGVTAIPYGTYNITVTYSPRFGRYLPLLHDVPNFTGVRIHAGNTHKDTEGCILVGTKEGKHSILDSRKAFAKLYNKIVYAGQQGKKITLEIV